MNDEQYDVDVTVDWQMGSKAIIMNVELKMEGETIASAIATYKHKDEKVNLIWNNPVDLDEEQEKKIKATCIKAAKA